MRGRLWGDGVLSGPLCFKGFGLGLRRNRSLRRRACGEKLTRRRGGTEAYREELARRRGGTEACGEGERGNDKEEGGRCTGVGRFLGMVFHFWVLCVGKG